MNFGIAAGSATNLPKETVGKIIDNMREKSIMLSLAQKRGQFIEVENEKTMPVFSAFSNSRVFYTGGTTDITGLTEQTLTIATPDLFPKELGTYVYLPKKDAEVYASLGLEEKVYANLAEVMASVADEISIVGDTTQTSTNRLQVSNGLYTIANSGTLCAETAKTYSAKTADGVLSGVLDARVELASYADSTQTKNLVLLAAPSFLANAKKSAASTQIGFGIRNRPDLGLEDVVHIDGIPVIERQQLGTDIAVLANMNGPHFGYYGKITADSDFKIERNSYLLVIRFWLDMKWAFLDSNGKAEGLVKLSYSAS